MRKTFGSKMRRKQMLKKNSNKRKIEGNKRNDC